jgi:hypothetical protein
MKQIQVLKKEYDDNSIVWSWIKKGIKVTSFDDWKNIDKNIPVLCYSDLLNENVRTWLSNKQPAIYAGRGYLGNHLYKKRLFHRYSLNGWANIELKIPPHERWPLLKLDKHKWKVKKIKNVLIAPSKSTTKVWYLEQKHNWVEEISKKFSGADIKIRTKPGKAAYRYQTLWKDLDWADLVVSISSAITVEAFWYGKKVISLKPCPTWATGEQLLEDWKNPKEPEFRDQWYEHIAWSQFTNDEWRSGEAINLIESYFGNLTHYKHNYNYNL